MRSLLKFFKEIYCGPEPHDDTQWHVRDVTLPVRDVSGKWLIGPTVWRRRGPDGWQYKFRQETADEFCDRQW
jgi:hypothetical protein